MWPIFKKIRLSGFSKCPDSSPAILIRISGILLCWKIFPLRMLYGPFLQKANEFEQFYVKVLLPSRKWKYECVIKTVNS